MVVARTGDIVMLLFNVCSRLALCSCSVLFDVGSVSSAGDVCYWAESLQEKWHLKMHKFVFCAS